LDQPKTLKTYLVTLPWFPRRCLAVMVVVPLWLTAWPLHGLIWLGTATLRFGEWAFNREWIGRWIDLWERLWWGNREE
jgi:hypothetical protein